MDIKRFETIVFNAFAWIAVLIAIVLLCCGVYRAYAAEMVERIEPTNVQEPHFSSVEAKEPEAVVLNCTVVEKADTEEIEPKYTDADLEMLALVIYQEAGSDACTDEVRMMVGNVVLNRIADPRFPNTMEEVLTAVSKMGYGAYGRLHWTGIVWPDRASHPSEAHAVERAYDCAERLLNGERVFADDVVWQAEFMQGTELVEQQGGFFFCRG